MTYYPCYHYHYTTHNSLKNATTFQTYNFHIVGGQTNHYPPMMTSRTETYLPISDGSIENLQLPRDLLPAFAKSQGKVTVAEGHGKRGVAYFTARLDVDLRGQCTCIYPIQNPMSPPLLLPIEFTITNVLVLRCGTKCFYKLIYIRKLEDPEGGSGV